MKKNRLLIKTYYLLFLLSFFIIQSCTMHTYLVGVDASAKLMDNQKYTIIAKNVVGQSSSFRLLWALLVTRPADYKEAIENAINENGGDNLINVQYTHERQNWILGTLDIYIVKGDVIRYEEEEE